MEDSKKRGISWQEIEKEGLWEERDWRLFIWQPVKHENYARRRGRKDLRFSQQWF
jgi:hypothetical protein